MFLHQQHQGHGHHQFVRHRVKERAEGRALFQATGQVTVQPVGGGCEGEYRAGGQVAPFDTANRTTG
jgi:hypothetical protein